jgi:hypothetical protein
VIGDRWHATRGHRAEYSLTEAAIQLATERVRVGAPARAE